MEERFSSPIHTGANDAESGFSIRILFTYRLTAHEAARTCSEFELAGRLQG
jgi:hypothetical protein